MGTQPTSDLMGVYHIVGEEQWSQLPENANRNGGLVVIDGLLTSVGGFNNSSYINSLFY